MSSQNRSRSVRFEFRCTPEEAKIINGKAAEAGMNRTEFLIKALSEKDIIVIDGLREILYELKREGINLNQALKLANAGIDVEKLNVAIKNCNAIYQKYFDFFEENRK